MQKCPTLSRVSLLTTRDPEDGKNQEVRLDELRKSLASRLVDFDVTYSDTLHDRKIA